jgi:hypothetical protein
MSMSPFFPCLNFFMSPSPFLHVNVSHVFGIPRTENGTKGNWQLSFVCCKRKTETENFVFLGLQTINGNRRLLCQQTCPSMATWSPDSYPKFISNINLNSLR